MALDDVIMEQRKAAKAAAKATKAKLKFNEKTKINTTAASMSKRASKIAAKRGIAKQPDEAQTKKIKAALQAKSNAAKSKAANKKGGQLMITATLREKAPQKPQPKKMQKLKSVTVIQPGQQKGKGKSQHQSKTKLANFTNPGQQQAKHKTKSNPQKNQQPQRRVVVVPTPAPMNKNRQKKKRGER